MSRDSEPSEQAEQPDELPDDRVQSDDKTVPRVRDGNFRNVDGVVPIRQVGPVLPAPAPVGQTVVAEEPIPVRFGRDALVDITPVSGRRFHIACDCDGLRQANSVQQISFDDMRARCPGRFAACWCCEALM